MARPTSFSLTCPTSGRLSRGQLCRSHFFTPGGSRHICRFLFVFSSDARRPKDVTIVNASEWQTEEFLRHRPHLRAVAYRMLGSLSDADDVVQEAWLRLSRSDAAAVENMRGWLTTVVARLSLDELRTRRSRGEQPLAGRLPDVLVEIGRASCRERV